VLKLLNSSIFNPNRIASNNIIDIGVTLLELFVKDYSSGLPREMHNSIRVIWNRMLLGVLV